MMPKRNILQQDFFPLHVYLQLWNTVSSKHINEGEGRVISTMLLANPPSPYFILYFFFEFFFDNMQLHSTGDNPTTRRPRKKLFNLRFLTHLLVT